MKILQTTKIHQRGLSLIEFMVASLLGVILIGGAISVYLASNRSFFETERYTSLADSGRFSTQLFNDALRHVGYFSGVAIQDINLDSGLVAVANDCSGDAAAHNMQEYLIAAEADGSGIAFGCITDAVPGSEVLVAKSLRPAPLFDSDPDDPNSIGDGVIDFPTGLDAQTTYVIASGEQGLLMDGDDTPPDVSDGQAYARGAAWPYQSQVFYIRAPQSAGDLPTLVRKNLVWNATLGSMSMETEELVRGVERMRFRFGWDSGVDGNVDQFGDWDDVPAGEWNTVGIVEVYMLLRSIDTDPNYENDKTYNLPGEVITPSTDPNMPNNVWRLLVSSSITLRNPNLYMRGGS